MAKAKRVRMRYLNLDPYGEIVAAKLEIMGHLSSFTLEHMPLSDAFNNFERFGRESCFKIESVYGERSFSCQHIRLVFDVESAHIQLPVNLFYLPLLQTYLGFETEYDGLILETGDAPGVFKGAES
jgi:hypothetical protein